MQGGYRVNRLPCKLLPWTRQGVSRQREEQLDEGAGGKPQHQCGSKTAGQVQMRHGLGQQLERDTPQTRALQQCTSTCVPHASCSTPASCTPFTPLPHQDPCEVHLDDNLRRALLANPARNTAPFTLVEPVSFRALELALWADTSFLASLNIMDYSLLVGAGGWLGEGVGEGDSDCQQRELPRT